MCNVFLAFASGMRICPRSLTCEGTFPRRKLLPSGYPPPPVPKNHLAQEPTPGSAVKFSHHFFYQGSGTTSSIPCSVP